MGGGQYISPVCRYFRLSHKNISSQTCPLPQYLHHLSITKLLPDAIFFQKKLIFKFGGIVSPTKGHSVPELSCVTLLLLQKNETPFSYLAKLFDIRVSWMFNEIWRGFSGLISWEASGQKKNDTNLVFWKYFKTDFLTKICSWSEISRWTSKDKPCWNQHSGLQEVARIVIFPIWGKQLEVPPKLNAWLCNSFTVQTFVKEFHF